MSQDPQSLPPCHFCHAAALRLVQGYEQLRLVSSDCQPIDAGGQLAVCGSCGGVQKPIDTRWQARVAKIYSSYQIYHQSGGVEQVIFDQNTGRADTRSAALLARLFEALPTPPAQTGKLLDVGCGNGALLAAFGHQRPNWQLAGNELSADHQQRIEAIAGVNAFYAGSVDDVPGAFDLITLIHVLEHVPEPAAFLKKLAGRLPVKGVGEDDQNTPPSLLIEVPDHTRNPFDLLIADHSAHFTKASLGAVLAQAGFEMLLMRDDIVPKELSAAACRVRDEGEKQSIPSSSNKAEAAVAFDRVQSRVDWLGALVELAMRTAADGPLGVFGTSIAGTWLGATLGDRISFYVDEDTARHGRRFMGKPVMGVKNAPAGVPVLLALPPWLAADVGRRLSKSGIEWLLPPGLA